MNNAELFFSAAGGAAGYEIERSLRFDPSSSGHLSRTPASDDTTWTFSCWAKRAKIGGEQMITGWISGGVSTYLEFTTGNNFSLNGSGINQGITTAVYRDASAWYHLVCSVTSGATSYLYVNGVQAASWTASASTVLFKNGVQNNISGYGSSGGYYFDGYLADVHFIDGQALGPTSFGEFDDNGVWQPIEYAGTYGTNGFHLPLSDNSSASALGTDTSGNGNDWTVNNISVAPGAGNDSLLDSPTNGDTANDTGAGGEVPGNYATMSPIIGFVDYTQAAKSNGNLQVDWSASTTAWSDWGLTSGKWYYETTMLSGVSGSTGNWVRVGSKFSTSYTAFRWRANGGTTGLTGSPTFSTYATGDVLGVAIDVDNEQATFYKNGVLQGTGAYSYLTAGGEPVHIGGYADVASSTAFNFGQRPYAYQNPGTNRPSTDYKPLCTAFLDTPTIEDPSTVMDVALYTGNGSTQTISGLGFSPDLVWIKRRNATSSHSLFDIIRGTNKVVRTNLTNEERTDITDTLNAFNSDGFDLGADTSYGGVNLNSSSYVAWTWDAGSSTVSNTDGTITSNVRANTSAGFSIVTYTGNGASASVGHGLGVKPALTITKNRSNASDWLVYTDVIDGSMDYLNLQSTASKLDSGFSLPTSTVVYRNANINTGALGDNYVMYCFTPVKNYSAFGSYIGNGQSGDSAPFIWTGFRPRWLLIKNTTSGSAEEWILIDSALNPSNVVKNFLYPNDLAAESVSNFYFDLLSNGFKLRNSTWEANLSNHTYLYMALAESPFKYARAR